MISARTDRKALVDESDESLARRSQGRDHEAFAALVDRYKHRVSWLVRRLVGPEEQEDITQEVFLRVYRALPSFRTDGSFRAWLYRIARNLCLSELRKRSRRGQPVAFDEVGEECVHRLLPTTDQDLEHKLEEQDISRSVRKLVGCLPDPYSTVLTLFYLNQLRYEEIAEVMSVPLGTVKTHLHRARLRLRDMILDQPGLVGLVPEPCTNTADAGSGFP